MKVKIVSRTYYAAETEDGKRFDVDIRNSIIKHAFDNNLEIEGEIHREEKQDRYVNGEYARSYTVREKFIPKKEKITLTDEPMGKYEMKFGKEFTKVMKEIYDESNDELKIDQSKVIIKDPILIKEGTDKPVKPKLHLTLPEKENK